jgi:hypothetical protein
MTDSDKSRVADIATNAICPQCRKHHSSDEQGVLVDAIKSNWLRIDQIVRQFEGAVALSQQSERRSFEVCLNRIAAIIPSASICDVAYIIALWRGGNRCGADLPAYVVPAKVAAP